MTIVGIRQDFTAKIIAYRGAWHTDRRNAAKALIAALDAHPWLIDQIAWDVHDMARADAKG